MRRATPRFASLTALVAGALLAAPAIGALPAPSAEAKAKAVETAAKTAWTDKVGAYQLCGAQDRVSAHYRKHATAIGKAASAAVETPACADPGPFVAPPVATVATTPPTPAPASTGAIPPTGTGTGSAAKPATAPPLEAAGAHSPPATATAPPSSKATATELQGPAKK